MDADERRLLDEQQRDIDALRDDLQTLRRAVQEMRARQREYFRRAGGKDTKALQQALKASKAAEAKVDELLRVTATRALF